MNPHDQSWASFIRAEAEAKRKKDRNWAITFSLAILFLLWL